MRGLRILLCFGLFLVPTVGLAGLSDGELPAARWYVHVDLEEMRSSEAGKPLYEWLYKEVISEIREEAGFDADAEADTITALATLDGGLIVSMEGNFSQTTQDRLVALGAMSDEFDQYEHKNKTYYRIENDDIDHDSDITVEDLYYSVALKNRIVAASSEATLKEMLDNRGKIPSNYDAGDALVVLTAKKNLVQAGMDADSLGVDSNWDSNVLRNAQEIAVLLADKGGKLAIEAQLVAEEAEVANSLASIVRGLISLQIFDEDMDPEISALLQSTTVDVDGVNLHVGVSLDSDMVISVLDD